MKTKNYFLVLVTVLLLMITQQSCKKDNQNQQKKEQPDISVVDISQELGWDYWVVGKKDYYFLKINNSVPEVMSFHSSEANKDYTIFYNENGGLDKVVVDDYIFIFRNFNGNKVDIGIVYPDGNTELLRGVETSHNWDGDTFKQGENSDAWSDVIRVAARVASGVPCALSVAATVASGGSLAPVAIWTCGNFLLDLTADVMEHDFQVHNGFTEFADAYSTFSFIKDCSTPDPLQCASGIASKSLHSWADHVAYLETHHDKVQNIITNLGGDGNNPSPEVDGFRFTGKKYSETDNLEQAVMDEFGNNYRIADFNDLITYAQNNDIEAWADKIGLKDEIKSLMVTYNGAHFWEGSRHYFLSRHDHNPPGSYLVHADIDNHFIDLGSWYGLNMPILCKKINK